MKGKRCFGVLLALSTIFGLFLNVYSDVSAIRYNQFLTYVDTLQSGGYKCGYRKSTQTDLTELSSTCLVPSTSTSENVDGVSRYVDYIKSNNTFDVKKDNFYELKFFIRQMTSSTYPLPVIYSFPTSDNSALFSVKDVDVEIIGDGTQSYFSLVPSSIASNQTWDLDLYPTQIVQYTVLLKPLNDANGVNFQFGKAGSHIFVLPPSSSLTSGYATTPIFQIAPQSSIDVFKVDDSSSEMNEKDNEDRDNLESQSSSTESTADSSSQDAENTGTTLLGAFSSFVSAITSATPSNCNFDMDLGNLDLGVVNLCQLSLPQPFPTIASIMLILFCVPLSISTARKVISLFRSFQ